MYVIVRCIRVLDSYNVWLYIYPRLGDHESCIMSHAA